MNEEIKEILEDVKRHLDYVEATKQSSIRDNEIKAMYDYIINLQKRNKELEDGFKSTTEELCEYAEKSDKLEIRNGMLRNENTELKEENETLKNLNVCVGCDNNPSYKARIDKAIEDLKQTLQVNKHHIEEIGGYEEEWVVLDIDHIQHLIDILKGE